MIKISIKNPGHILDFDAPPGADPKDILVEMNYADLQQAFAEVHLAAESEVTMRPLDWFAAFAMMALAGKEPAPGDIVTVNIQPYKGGGIGSGGGGGGSGGAAGGVYVPQTPEQKAANMAARAFTIARAMVAEKGK